MNVRNFIEKYGKAAATKLFITKIYSEKEYSDYFLGWGAANRAGVNWSTIESFRLSDFLSFFCNDDYERINHAIDEYVKSH